MFLEWSEDKNELISNLDENNTFWDDQEDDSGHTLENITMV